MTSHRSFVLALLVLLTTTASSQASLVWLDLSGWDHSQITSGGQTFTDIYNDVDLTVTASGNHPVPSTFGTTWVLTGNSLDANQFVFSFSQSLPLVVEFRTLDPQEELSVAMAGSKSYSHISGALPTISGDMLLTGNAFGMSSTGASHGQIFSTGTSNLSLGYEALANNKFEQIRLGVQTGPVVPEPATGVVFGLSTIGFILAQMRRKD
jgi:hypothetical protein